MSDLVAQARQLYELAWLGKSARVRELASARLGTAMHELLHVDPTQYQALCEELIARAAEMAARRAVLERETEVQV